MENIRGVIIDQKLNAIIYCKRICIFTRRELNRDFQSVILRYY